MIVVEGPDGAGKTTLINRLVQEFDIPVAPRVVSKDAEAMVDLKRWTENNVAGGFQATIFDRHRLISEPIYGPLLRTEPEPGFDNPVWFYNQLFKFYHLDPLVIYCLPPFETVYNNVKDDPDNRVVAGGPQMRILWGAYFNKAHTEKVLRPAHAMIYDYTNQYNNFHLTSIFGAVSERLQRHVRTA